MRTPAEAKQFVREHWERVGIEHYCIDGVRYWMVHQNGRGIPLHGYESPELAWSAAAEFTEQRMEAIHADGIVCCVGRGRYVGRFAG